LKLVWVGLSTTSNRVYSLDKGVRNWGLGSLISFLPLYLREEFADDAPFVGRRWDRLDALVHVGCVVYVGYFLDVCRVDDDLRPFLLARIVANPNIEPRHVNYIQMKYWI